MGPIQVTPEILGLIAEIDEFKAPWGRPKRFRLNGCRRCGAPPPSATNNRRPEFQRMMEAGAAKPPAFDVGTVHSFSRFSRLGAWLSGVDDKINGSRKNPEFLRLQILADTVNQIVKIAKSRLSEYA